MTAFAFGFLCAFILVGVPLIGAHWYEETDR